MELYINVMCIQHWPYNKTHKKKICPSNLQASFEHVLGVKFLLQSLDGRNHRCFWLWIIVHLVIEQMTNTNALQLQQSRFEFADSLDLAFSVARIVPADEDRDVILDLAISDEKLINRSTMLMRWMLVMIGNVVFDETGDDDEKRYSSWYYGSYVMMMFDGHGWWDGTRWWSWWWRGWLGWWGYDSDGDDCSGGCVVAVMMIGDGHGDGHGWWSRSWHDGDDNTPQQSPWGIQLGSHSTPLLHNDTSQTWHVISVPKIEQSVQ